LGFHKKNKNIVKEKTRVKKPDKGREHEKSNLRNKKKKWTPNDKSKNN